jgi:hypothetical protein
LSSIEGGSVHRSGIARLYGIQQSKWRCWIRPQSGIARFCRIQQSRCRCCIRPQSGIARFCRIQQSRCRCCIRPQSGIARFYRIQQSRCLPLHPMTKEVVILRHLKKNSQYMTDKVQNKGINNIIPSPKTNRRTERNILSSQRNCWSYFWIDVRNKCSSLDKTAQGNPWYKAWILLVRTKLKLRISEFCEINCDTISKCTSWMSSCSTMAKLPLLNYDLYFTSVIENKHSLLMHIGLVQNKYCKDFSQYHNIIYILARPLGWVAENWSRAAEGFGGEKWGDGLLNESGDDICFLLL